MLLLIKSHHQLLLIKSRQHVTVDKVSPATAVGVAVTTILINVAAFTTWRSCCMQLASRLLSPLLWPCSPRKPKWDHHNVAIGILNLTILLVLVAMVVKIYIYLWFIWKWWRRRAYKNHLAFDLYIGVSTTEKTFQSPQPQRTEKTDTAVHYITSALSNSAFLHRIYCCSPI